MKKGFAFRVIFLHSIYIIYSDSVIAFYTINDTFIYYLYHLWKVYNSGKWLSIAGLTQRQDKQSVRISKGLK